MTITRDLKNASRDEYDVIVIGGGIYGVMLSLEASLRGLATLLVEKGDFGGATSFNSLKTLHGGLRYLQSLNLARYQELVAERSWFLRHFPDLAEPLPVLMPLYEEGIRRTSIFRTALLLDRQLSKRRNDELPEHRKLPDGRVIPADEVKKRFEWVREDGLGGGALWYDGRVPNTQRLIIEILRSACALGAVAANYTCATELRLENEKTAGIEARDVLTGDCYEFRSPVVINAAGPWCREVCRRLDRDVPELFHFSLAWNVLFDREALSDCAVAVSPPAGSGRIYFVHPWKNRLLAGTGHAPRLQFNEYPEPSGEELDGFLSDLNAAIPRLNVTRRDILHVFPGLIPVKKPGTLAFESSDRMIHHADHAGPEGLFSIRGTKLTTARSAAERSLSQIFPHRVSSSKRQLSFESLRSARYASSQTDFDGEIDALLEDPARDRLLRIIREESVCHLDDLMLRRTMLGDDPSKCLSAAESLCTLFEWSEARSLEEMNRLRHHFHHFYGESEFASWTAECS